MQAIKPSPVFVFARFCYLKKKYFVVILFCGLVYVFCAEDCTYVLHEPFIELSLALNILLYLVLFFSFCWLVWSLRERNNFIRLNYTCNRVANAIKTVLNTLLSVEL